MAETNAPAGYAEFECLLSEHPDEAWNVAFMEGLRAALAELPMHELTPAQLAVRQRNHDRLVRMGLKHR